jgi:prophage antirepressor-like protein
VSALAVFAFGEQVVRISDRDGSPWFVGRDVCAALAIAKPQNALARLPDDEKGALIVGTLGGNQEMIVISEAGMYRLVLTSRTEPAERFKTWVVQDVLPSIRRTGSYRMPLPANDQAEPSDLAALLETAAGCRTINAKIALVRAAGNTFGNEAAQEAWRRCNLPDVAPEASAHFIGELDAGLVAWFDERCELVPDIGTTIGELYADYLRWCRWFGGATARDEHHLVQLLRSKGLEIDIGGTARGLALNPPPSMAIEGTPRRSTWGRG